MVIISGNKPKPMSQILRDSVLINHPEAVRFLIAALIGGSLLGLAGLTLTGTMIALFIATPILVLFSPIIVPSIVALSLVTTGFMFSGGCLAATLAAVAWTYHYFTGKHLTVAEQLHCLKVKIGGRARDVKERVVDNGSQKSQLVQEK
ncbi:PREDICTED: oleosin 16 kDa [Erythranthe guttata]|nr:PREDICTED: oleosin 16 kDa [Erythranthe guttata]|eukprot:XP_012857791.1 PREDICTED: oleosin 16 kDa [Erythranthe guttata]